MVHRQTELTPDAVGEVMPHPSGKPERKRREEDLVEDLVPKRSADRLQGTGVPHLPVDLGSELPEASGGLFEPPLRDLVSRALRPGEIFIGRSGRDQEVEGRGTRCQKFLHLGGQSIAGKGLVADYQGAAQWSQSRVTPRATPGAPRRRTAR